MAKQFNFTILNHASIKLKFGNSSIPDHCNSVDFNVDETMFSTFDRG